MAKNVFEQIKESGTEPLAYLESLSEEQRQAIFADAKITAMPESVGYCERGINLGQPEISLQTDDGSSQTFKITNNNGVYTTVAGGKVREVYLNEAGTILSYTVGADEIFAGKYREWLAKTNPLSIDDLIKTQDFDGLVDRMKQREPISLKQAQQLARLFKHDAASGFLHHFIDQVNNGETLGHYLDKVQSSIGDFEYKELLTLPAKNGKTASDSIKEKKIGSLSKYIPSIPSISGERPEVKTEIETHQVSIHSSVDMSAIRLFDRFLERHGINQGYTKKSKKAVKIDQRSDALETAVTNTINKLQADLNEWGQLGDAELKARLEGADIKGEDQLKAVKFNLAVAKRLVDDVVSHNSFHFADKPYFTVLANEAITCGLQLKDLLAVTYNALSDRDNIAWQPGGDKAKEGTGHMVRFITHLKETRREYNSNDKEMPDKNKCSGGTANHLLYAVNGIHNMVDVAYITRQDIQRETSILLNAAVVKHYETLTSPDQKELFTKQIVQWQANKKMDAAYCQTLKPIVIDGLSKAFGRYFTDEHEYLGHVDDHMASVKFAPELQKLFTGKQMEDYVSPAEYAKLVVDNALPLYTTGNELTLDVMAQRNLQFMNKVVEVLLEQGKTSSLVNYRFNIEGLVPEGREAEFAKAAIAACNIELVESLYQKTKPPEMLIDAARSGKMVVVDKLVNLGAAEFINKPDALGITAFMLAVVGGDLAMVESLGRIPGIDPNVKDNDGYTALIRAVVGGDPAMVESVGRIPGIDPNVRDNSGMTALIHAVVGGNQATVESLGRIPGIDPNVQDNYGRTALMHAVVGGNQAMIESVGRIPGIDPNVRDNSGYTALMHAVWGGDLATVESVGRIPGIDPNGKDNSGMTALMYAVVGGNQAMIESLCKIPGIDPNVKNNYGFTTLMLVAKRGDLATVESVGRIPGIDPNGKDNSGMTALMHAAERGDLATVESLGRIPGIDPNVRDNSGYTALIHAVIHAVWGGDLATVESVGRIPGIDPNVKDNDGMTALMHAAGRGDLATVESVGKIPGIDPNVRDNYGMTALMLAAKRDDLAMVESVGRIPGIDLNVKDNDGTPALVWALENGCFKSAAWLVENGADADGKTKAGKSAFELAADAGQTHLAARLQPKLPGTQADNPPVGHAVDHDRLRALAAGIGRINLEFPDDKPQAAVRVQGQQQHGR